MKNLLFYYDCTTAVKELINFLKTFDYDSERSNLSIIFKSVWNTNYADAKLQSYAAS